MLLNHLEGDLKLGLLRTCFHDWPRSARWALDLGSRHAWDDQPEPEPLQRSSRDADASELDPGSSTTVGV